jgi:beta-phosphoglucomutase
VIRAIVFDFDGVLANSEPLHLEAYQRVFARHGGSLDPAEYYARYLGYDDVSVLRQYSAAQGWNTSGDAIGRLLDEKTAVFDEALQATDVLFPGAVECVRRLAADFPLGIASGALRHEIEAIVQRGGLSDCFRFIVAAGETPAGKPAPDPYLRAADLHGAEPGACVAIEDSRWGIESAHAAGLKCIGVASTYPAHAIGMADLVVDGLADITVATIARLE